MMQPGSSKHCSARKLRVFVVEDHPDTVWGLRRYLQARGHDVLVATDMTSALEVAQEERFDVLLSDLGLPDGSGWSLLQTLRSRGPVKAIAMSGFNSDADRERSERVGFLQHLAKPVRPEMLNAAIELAVAS